MKDEAVKYFGAAFVSTAAVFAPIKGMIVVTLLVVFVDLVLGILVARKKKQKITSSKIAITISKTLIFLTAICMTFLVQTFLLDNSVEIVKWVAALIGAREIFSVMESLNYLSEDKLFTEILTRLSSMNHKKEEEKKGSDDPPTT